VVGDSNLAIACSFFCCAYYSLFRASREAGSETAAQGGFIQIVCVFYYIENVDKIKVL